MNLDLSAKQGAERLVRAVSSLWGIEPTCDSETLPLVDAYLRDHVANMVEADRVRSVVDAGSYFGEILLAEFGGRWSFDPQESDYPYVELGPGVLKLCPAGMVGEVVTGCETAAFDGSFSTAPELRDGLAEALACAAPLQEDEYFSLCGRLDGLYTAMAWLVLQTARQDEGTASATESISSPAGSAAIS